MTQDDEIKFARTCTSINSGMLDKLNNFVVPRSSFSGSKLGPDELEELHRIVNKRRPYRLSDFKDSSMIPDLSDI